jgi:hypothetical protein
LRQSAKSSFLGETWITNGMSSNWRTSLASCWTTVLHRENNHATEFSVPKGRGGNATNASSPSQAKAMLRCERLSGVGRGTPRSSSACRAGRGRLRRGVDSRRERLRSRCARIGTRGQRPVRRPRKDPCAEHAMVAKPPVAGVRGGGDPRTDHAERVGPKMGPFHRDLAEAANRWARCPGTARRCTRSHLSWPSGLRPPSTAIRR